MSPQDGAAPSSLLAEPRLLSGFSRSLPMRLLVVEDSNADFRLLQELLCDSVEIAPEITHSPTMKIALAHLSRETFDCVLLDLGLPDGTGADNVHRVHQACGDAAIVVMTGHDDDRKAFEALQYGAQDYLVKGQLGHEALVRRLNFSIERNRVLSQVNLLRQQDREVAQHDLLTGLANRLLLADRAAEAIAQAKRRGEKLAICYVDLDRFKPINDNLGHAAGDAVLRAVARILQRSARETDTVARVGGDEFVVLQSPTLGVEDAIRAGQRIVAAIQSLTTADGYSVSLGASVGVSIYPDDGKSLEQLLSAADEAMYSAKRAGGGRVCTHNAPAQPPAAHSADAALVANQICLQ